MEYCRNRKDDVASALLVLLYFGLRQSELPSIKIINDNTLECETSKERMGRNVTLRCIPFTPMFRKVKSLVDFEKAKNVNVYTLRSAFKRLFPEHHPRELRYTFITRCKECVQKGNLKIIIASKKPKFKYIKTEHAPLCAQFLHTHSNKTFSPSLALLYYFCYNMLYKKSNIRYMKRNYSITVAK